MIFSPLPQQFGMSHLRQLLIKINAFFSNRRNFFSGKFNLKSLITKVFNICGMVQKNSLTSDIFCLKIRKNYEILK